MSLIPALTSFGRLLRQLKSNTRLADQKRILLDAVIDDTTSVALLWQFTLHPYITFGITDVPKNAPAAGTCNWRKAISKITWDDLIELLNDLYNRKLTGHTAQGAVFSFNAGLDDADARHGFRCLIRRRPACNVGAKKLNRIFPGIVPQFNVSLADTWGHGGEKIMSKVSKSGLLIEDKENGERRIFIAKSGQLKTRSGREDANFPCLVDHLMRTLDPGVVLDGELIPNDDDFFRMAQYTKKDIRYTVLDELPVTFVVFDCLPYLDWLAQSSNIPQITRTNWVQEAQFGHQSVRAVRSEWIRDKDKIEEMYLTNLREGREGIILKAPYAPYAFKRNSCWVKRKLDQTEDLMLLSVESGDADTAWEHSTGRLVCRRDNGVEVRVSPGRMTANMRDIVWADQEAFVGRVMEVGYQDETPDGSIQHPRFLMWRDDKDEQ